MNKTVFAAASMLAVALYATEASAQATPFYDSPAHARTYDENGYWTQPVPNSHRRTVARHRGVETYATPVAPPMQWPVGADDHTLSVKDY